MPTDLLEVDKQFLEYSLLDDWPNFSGKCLFLTGGTGFVGKNLLSAIQILNRASGLEALSVVVLSRDPAKFMAENPNFSEDSALSFLKGDIRDFNYGQFRADFVIHGATDVGDIVRAAQNAEVLAVGIDGTRKVVEAAKYWSSTGFLLLSSGAVYGRQDPDEEFLEEQNKGAPNMEMANSAYGEGKRVAEWLVHDLARTTGVNIKIARLFAFVGPWLPLDGPFAAGNFVKDCLSNRDIVVGGDGTPLRSYLYSVELAIWLLKVLLHGPNGSIYNVGSSDSVSIRELAHATAAAWGGTSKVVVLKEAAKDLLPERYVPLTSKIAQSLQLVQKISLGEALVRHRKWLQGERNDER